MRRKPLQYAGTILAACTLLFLVSCQSIQRVDRAGENRDAGSAKEEAYDFLDKTDGELSPGEREATRTRAPEWTRTYPEAGGYYVGIGHSPDKGDPGEDRRRARLSALNELAQGISVHIEGEVADRRGERYGRYYEEMEINIRSSVDLTVQEAELVDSYHSKAEGYWVYYRLSKEQWEQQERERKRRLVERVGLMVEAPENGPLPPVSGRLSSLSNAIAVTQQAGSAGTARAVLFGNDGYLLDLLVYEREALMRSLQLEVSPTELAVSPAGSADVAVAVGSNRDGQPGVFRVLFEDGRGKRLAAVATGEDGRYKGRVDLGKVPYGRSTVTARIDLAVPRETGGAPNTTTRVAAKRRPYTALLVVAHDGGIGESQVYGNALDILSFLDMPAMRITSEGEGHDLVFEFTPLFRVVDNDRYSLVAAYAAARFTVRRGGDVLYSYGSDECKDMGLDGIQAKQRAFSRLVDSLKTDKRFQHALKGELSTLLAR